MIIKNRLFLHLAILFSLWSCSQNNQKVSYLEIVPTEQQIKYLHEFKNSYVNSSFDVDIKLANLTSSWPEIKFHPSKYSPCLELDLWTEKCEQERILWYPTVLNRWLPYLMHYPPESSVYGGFEITFSSLGLYGLLYLNPQQKKAPLYIVRGGIGSRADSFRVERPLLLSLIYHKKAHVLFIGSSVNDVTLSEFNFSNSGPLADYYHNFYLLNFFSQNGFKQWFEKIHLIAISMSGFGAYLSSNFDPLGSSLTYDQISLLCPFISYPLSPPSLDRFFHYQITKQWALRRFQRTLAKINYQNDDHPLKPIFQSLEKTQSLAFKSGRYEELKKWHFDQSGKQLEYHDFLKDLIYSWPHKTAIHVLLSHIDSIVDPFSHGILLKNEKIKTTWFQRGFHCQFYLAYPTSTIADFF